MSAKTKFEIVDGKNIKINASLSKEQYNTFKEIAAANGGDYDKESKLFTFQDARGATGTKTAADLNAGLMEDFKNVELVDSTIKINSMSKAQFTYLVKTAEKNNGTYDKEKKSILFQNAEDAVKTFGAVFKEEAKATSTVQEKEKPMQKAAKEAKAKVGFEQDGTKVSANGFLQKWEFAVYATVAGKNGGKYDTESKGFVFQDVRGATDFVNEAQKDFKELSAVYATKPQAKEATTTDDAPKAAEQASTASNVRRNR